MKKLKLLILSILMPWCAFAWHANGHSTAGAVAYYYLLKNNPTVLKQVVATLRLHYWYKTSHWKSVLAKLPANQQDVGLFILASTYPDDAKADPNNTDGDATHKLWHYVDFPFVVPGSGVTGLPPKTPNARQKIAAFMVSIPAEKNSAQRALELAWFFHLVEDIHQPLHCSSMFNKVHKTGDAGGNSTIVKPGSVAATDLHSFWDDLVKGTLTTYAANAMRLLAKYPESKLTELTTNKTPDAWMSNESSPDAVKFAYVNGTINGLKAKPTVLSAKYMSTAKTLGERRVTLAGVRLGKLLVSFYTQTLAKPQFIK